VVNYVGDSTMAIASVDCILSQYVLYRTIVCRDESVYNSGRCGYWCKWVKYGDTWQQN
jgi:hypothetical protein